MLNLRLEKMDAEASRSTRGKKDAAVAAEPRELSRMQDIVNELCQKSYQKVYKKAIDNDLSDSLIKSLSYFRYASSALIDSPRDFFSSLFASSDSGQYVFPCDIVEMRQVLQEKSIRHNNDRVPLFNIKFAEKYFNQYPVLLLLDKRALGKSEMDKGCALYSSPLSVGNALKRIVINAPVSKESVNDVKRIVADTRTKADVFVSNSVPGLSSQNVRLSGKKFNMKKQAQSEISLSPMEQKIFDFLKTAKQAVAPGAKMLVAGGWTRDKLMNVESDDIDIAVSQLPGFDLAQRIEQYAKANGIKDVGPAYRVSLDKGSDEKNDQLMVGGLPVFGMKLELVPMRTEAYNPESRTPVIQRTDNVAEDAMRRDLTINAMYYDIDTGQIVDPTGGREDMQKKVLRTPEPDPTKTFMEDPLRVLRALRFRSRYGDYHLDEKIIKAMASPQVQEAYKAKVAPERAGKEIMKMMQGSDPADAVSILFETGLYRVAFNVPSMQNLKDVQMDQQNKHHKLNLMRHTVEVLRNLNDLMKDNGESNEMRGLMNIAAMFHDFGKLHPEIQQPDPKDPDNMQYLGHEDVSAEIADEVLKSIGIGSDNRKVVTKVVEMHMRPHTEKWTNKSMGKFIRKTRIPGQEDLDDKIWRYIMMHSMADSMSKGSDDYHDDVALKEQHMQQFDEYIKNMQQQNISVDKPILNGNEIMTMFPGVDPRTGFIKAVQEMLIDGVSSGEITNKQEAINKVMEWKNMNLNSFTGGVQAMNWYKSIKQADASGGGGGGIVVDEGDPNPYEGTPIGSRTKGQVRMERTPVKPTDTGPHAEHDPLTDETRMNRVVEVPFGDGDRVRKRRPNNLSSKQEYGRVVSVGNNVLAIKWDGQDDVEELPLNDPVTIHHNVARA